MKLSRAVVVVVLVLGQLIAIPLLRFDLVRTGPLLAAALGVVVVLAMRILAASNPPERVRLALCLGLPTCVVLALTGPSAYGMGRAVLPLLLGWSVPLALYDWHPETTSKLRFAGRLRTAALAVIALGALGIWIAVGPPGQHPGLDETLYLMQSQHVRHAPFMRPLDYDLAPFFLIRQTYFRAGYINGQFPPGWPLVLSVASNFRAGWFLLLATHVSLLGATYAFGRVVVGARAGMLAAGLVAVGGVALNLSTIFEPHVFDAALALIAGALMVGTLGAPTRRRIAAWVLAGLLLGFATAMRPLTGIAMAATLWLWVLLRERPSLRTVAATTAAACVGGVVPIAFLMYYNLKTTGSPIHFGYDVAEHGLHALGFGMRGFVEYTTTGIPVERVTAFGPRQAVEYFRGNLYAGLIDFWPTALIFPIAYLASRAGVKWRRCPAVAFAVLPLAYFFYFYNYGGDRFYFELFPFAMVGTAFLVDGLAQRQKAIGIVVGSLLVATMLVDTGIMAVVQRRDYVHSFAPADVVERLRAGHPKLLVFVRSELAQQTADQGSEPIRWWGEPAMSSVYWYDIYGFPSDVVVARDLGTRDTVLTRRFPGRYNIVLSVLPGSTGGAPWVIDVRPLDPDRAQSDIVDHGAGR